MWRVLWIQSFTRRIFMLDLIVVLVTIVTFVAFIGFTKACELL